MNNGVEEVRTQLQTTCLLILAGTLVVSSGCRNRQFARVLHETDQDVVGSHSAGAETFNPLVQEAVGSLLAKQSAAILPQSSDPYASVPQEYSAGMTKRICFVGIENRSAEELGDFYDQLYQQIDTSLNDSHEVQLVNGRFVDAGLNATRLRPEELFIPANMREFTAAMEQSGHPFDCLVFGTLTSGTTENNGDYQRDYLLTLEMVDVQSGQQFKESAKIRKGYHKTALGKMSRFNPFRR